MSKKEVEVSIDITNESFVESPDYLELARTLHLLADNIILKGKIDRTLIRDSNNEVVGIMTIVIPKKHNHLW